MTDSSSRPISPTPSEPEVPHHVCGARGFGYSLDDTCPACDARNAKTRALTATGANPDYSPQREIEMWKGYLDEAEAKLRAAYAEIDRLSAAASPSVSPPETELKKLLDEFAQDNQNLRDAELDRNAAPFETDCYRDDIKKSRSAIESRFRSSREEAKAEAKSVLVTATEKSTARTETHASEQIQGEQEYRRGLLDDAHQQWAEEAKWRERLAEAIARVLKLQPLFHSVTARARTVGEISEETMTKMQAGIGRLSRILGASDRADKESLGESCFCHLPKCQWHPNERRLSDEQARAIILFYDCGYTGDRPSLESGIERLRSTIRVGPWQEGK